MKVSKRLRQSPSLAPQLASSTCAKDGASPSPPSPPAQKAARQEAQKEACQVRVGVGCLVEHPGILPVKVQRLRDQGRTPSAVELVVCRRCTPQLLDERQKRRQEERRGKFKSSNVLWGRLIHAHMNTVTARGTRYSHQSRSYTTARGKCRGSNIVKCSHHTGRPSTRIVRLGGTCERYVTRAKTRARTGMLIRSNGP